MLALCPSPRAAVSVSCTVVAVGGRLSAFAGKTPCHVPEPSGERPIWVDDVAIVSFCVFVVLLTMMRSVAMGVSTVGESCASKISGASPAAAYVLGGGDPNAK